MLSFCDNEICESVAHFTALHIDAAVDDNGDDNDGGGRNMLL